MMLDNFRLFMLNYFSPIVATTITSITIVALIFASIITISWVQVRDLPRNEFGWYGFCYETSGYWKEDGILTFTGTYARDMTENEYAKYCENELEAMESE